MKLVGSVEQEESLEAIWKELGEAQFQVSLSLTSGLNYGGLGRFLVLFLDKSERLSVILLTIYSEEF